MKVEFYKDWKKITKLEEQAIKSIKSAKKIILENIPREEIISIYVKGSFPRREMNNKSDVDTFTVLKHSKYLKKLQILKKKYREAFTPNIEFAGYSLWELKTNKRTKSEKRVRAAPSRTIQHLEHYELIYGKKLDKNDFYQGSDDKILKSTIKAFRDLFLPMYVKKKFGFSEIIKQTFWLVENHEKFKGNNPPHYWNGLDKSIKEKNHIIHDTLNLRLNPTKDKKIREKFVKKLEKYLDKLEKKL